MITTYTKLSASLSLAILLVGCGATTLVSTPVENIDAVPLKLTELTENQQKMNELHIQDVKRKENQ